MMIVVFTVVKCFPWSLLSALCDEIFFLTSGRFNLSLAMDDWEDDKL